MKKVVYAAIVAIAVSGLFGCGSGGGGGDRPTGKVPETQKQSRQLIWGN